MVERRSIFYRPRRQVFLLSLIVLIAYLVLLGPQGDARDVLVGEGFAFVSFGEHGGLRLFSLANPVEPEEVGVYDTSGSARRLARDGAIIYIADGPEGLRVVDVSNPRIPVLIGSVYIPEDAQDVVLDGNYAYLATGKGLQVVDISNPTNPRLVGDLETPGNARGVAVVEYRDPISAVSPDLPAGTEMISHYAFVADGNRGLQVIDIQLPITPVRIGSVDPQWEALDVDVVGPFAFVAAGSAGLRVLDVSNPVEPSEITTFALPGEVLSIQIMGTYAVLANGSGGVSIVDVSTPALPQMVSTYNTSGNAQRATVLGNLVYVADGIHGLRIVDISSPAAPHETGVVETIGEASVRQLLGAGWAIIRGEWETVEGKVWRTMLFVGVDMLLFFAALLFFLAFFGQFVLPVRTLRDRGRAIHRLLKYIRGNHGPAIYIKDGVIRQSHQEEHRRGPGVALLDTASAAVFRNAHVFTRAVGPGIVFTDQTEFPAGTVDLHRQIQTIGPSENEDPFKPKTEEELFEAFNERQKRRYATSGLTRDGVEIVPLITAVFSLKSQPAEGNTWFGYNPESIWRAIAGEGISPDATLNSQTRRVPWQWLPPRLAADLWREYLRKYTLDELFTLPTLTESGYQYEPGKTAYDTIVEMICARLKQEEVDDLDEFGRRTGDKKASKEHRILQEHGIEVHSVGVRHLRFPSRVEDQLIEEWTASWLQRAREEYKQIERLYTEEKLAGQDLAMKEFGSSTSQMLGAALMKNTLPEDLSSDPESVQVSMKMLLQGTLKLCIREPQLQQHLTNQMNELTEIIEWVGKQ